MKKLIYYFILTISFSPVVTKAQIATWNFFGQSSPASLGATTLNSNLVSPANITRGAAAASNGAANSFRTAGFQNNGIATTNTDYFQITLAAATGYKLSLSTIDANFNGTTTFYGTPGVTSQFAYSLDGTTFTLIGSPVTSTSLAMTQVSLSGISALQNVASGTTVTIRYYASGQTTTGGWGFYSSSASNNGLTIGGSVAAVSACAGPSLATNSSTSNITTTSADVQGNITAIGGGTTITARGIEYSTNGSLTSSTLNNETGSFSTGTFTRSLSSLTPNTQYYLRSYATNDCATPQTSNSSITSFTTLPNAPVAGSASGITSGGFSANWSAPATPGTAAYTYTLEIDDDNTFSSVLQTQSSIASGTTTYAVTGLAALSNYYYRVKTVNATGVSSWSATTGPVATPAAPPFTAQTGDWQLRTAGSYGGVTFSNLWQRYNGTSWVNVSGTPVNPGGSGSISRMIANGYVDAAGNAGTNNGFAFDIIVLNGGELDMYDNASGALSAVPAYFTGNRTLRVQNGGKLYVGGDFNMPAACSLVVESGGIVEIDQASVSATHPMWGGIENFQNGSTLILDDIDFTAGLITASNITANTGGYLLGNLTINVNATGGDWSITNGAGTYSLCQNDLTISNSGTKRISITGNTGTYNIGGNLYNNEGTFSFCSQLSTASGTQTINLNGNAELAGPVSLKYNSSNAFGNFYTSNINLKGNLTVYDALTDGPTFSASPGTLPVLTFNGSSTQTLDALSPVTLSNIVVNKPSGDLTLNAVLNVANNINLTKGIINTTSTNLLSLADNATATNASDASFVNGPVSKTGNDIIEFPIGSSGKYRPAAISAPSSVTDVFTAQYFSAPHASTTVNAPLNQISTTEYWNINRTGSSNVDVTLTWNSASLVDEAQDLRIAHYNGSSWDDLGNTGLTVNTTTDRITKTAVSSFSPFTIGTASLQPLPVKVIDFSLGQMKNGVTLNWQLMQTGDEIIRLERSNNGIDFLPINTRRTDKKLVSSYTYQDNDAVKGLNYYRLSIEETNGNVVHSNILSASFNKSEAIQCFPSPANSQLHLTWETDSTPSAIALRNINGTIVYTSSTDLNHHTIPVEKLSDGIYLLIWQHGNQSVQRQIQIKH